MKKILVLIVLLFLASCKKKSDSNLFMLGFLGILAEEPPVEVTVGGTVSGLSGSGLVLQNNGGDDLPISANGTFQFSSIIFEGGSYNVTVLTHPSNPSQTCEVSGGIGQALNTAITTVTVNCSTNSYSISGSVSGLASTGLTLTNGTDTVTVASNGTFAFPTTVPSGSSYNVTMTPSTGLIGDGSTTGPLQSCTLTNGGGIVSSATVSNISLVCVTTTFNIRVNVAGYTSGSGMVLQNNLGDDLTVAANTTPVTFATKIASGSSYSVTVKTQPSVPSFICSVSGGSGVVTTGDVSSITVNCSQAYTVGGTTSGLAGSGLVLQNTNNGETVSISSTGTYAFATPLIGGTGYSIAVLSQPTNP
ncbi:MAG: hypothetical protein KDK36_10245 [Leptospiraceae bacterium]|nr:hypothetical protein [Leptospiraceae bacterium]